MGGLALSGPSQGFRVLRYSCPSITFSVDLGDYRDKQARTKLSRGVKDWYAAVVVDYLSRLWSSTLRVCIPSSECQIGSCEVDKCMTAELTGF